MNSELTNEWGKSKEFKKEHTISNSSGGRGLTKWDFRYVWKNK